MENITIATYYDYNSNRYSTPWVCLMTKDGQYDFKTRMARLPAATERAANLWFLDR